MSVCVACRGAVSDHPIQQPAMRQRSSDSKGHTRPGKTARGEASFTGAVLSAPNGDRRCAWPDCLQDKLSVAIDNLPLTKALRLVRRSFMNGLPPTGRSKELVTRFYQMPMETAVDLIDALPEMVQPPSWKSKANPDGGTIRVLSLGHKVTIPIPGDKTDGSKNQTNTQKTSQTSHREQKPVIPGDHRDRFSQRSTRNWNTNPPTVLLQLGRPSINERHLMAAGVKGTSGYTTLVNVAAPSNAVLVIQQTRAIHLKIDQLLLSMGLMTSGDDYVKEFAVKWHRAGHNYRSGGGGGMGTPSGFGMGRGMFALPAR